MSARLPGLQQPALNVMGAVQQLALSSQKLSDDTSDEVSKSMDDFHDFLYVSFCSSCKQR